MKMYTAYFNLKDEHGEPSFRWVRVIAKNADDALDYILASYPDADLDKGCLLEHEIACGIIDERRFLGELS